VPQISPGGLRNAATLAEVSPSRPLAPLALATIFGKNLGPGGTSITLNGIPAPLLYVSPTQINFQVPSALLRPSLASLVIRTDGGESAPVTVPIGFRTLGIFTQGAAGCGQGIVYNIHRDRSLTLNTPANSFDPIGDSGLRVYFTGDGFYPQAVDGVSAGNPLAFDPPAALAGLAGAAPTTAFNKGALAEVPGSPGVLYTDLNVVNFRTPLSLPDSCSAALSLTDFQSSSSQRVAFSVRAGGGVCHDFLPASLGSIRWTSASVHGVGTLTETASLDIQLPQSQGLDFPQRTFPNLIHTGPAVPEPSPCAQFDPTLLDAGNISASRPGNQPFSVPRSTGAYHIDLPGGSVGPGHYQVTAGGSPDVAAFTSAIDIPAPILITTPIAQGMFKRSGAIELHWTGGAPTSVVTAAASFRQPGTPTIFVNSATALATDGKLTLFACVGSPCEFPATDSVELLISVEPLETPVQTVPGLILGLKHAWRYEFRFPDSQAR
jgi:uncharacterized protein (TIGR03437 family)